MHPDFTHESATVEDVLSSVQDGYRSRAYIVTWHGSRILVSDPLAESDKHAGDSIDFIASRHEVNGDRILSFTSTEHGARQAVAASGPSNLRAAAGAGTGVVEEALGVQDGGFRFVAYLVRSHEQRVAVADPLALSHHAIGEQIDYTRSETTSSVGALLSFQVQLSAADRASLLKSRCGFQRSREAGVVDQVLSAAIDGYDYRAYVVAWRGSQIVIEDPTSATDYQAGDDVSFWMSRFRFPPPSSYMSQQFAFDRPLQTTVEQRPADLRMSMAMDSAPVRAVLTADLDGYRSIAYLVNWQNALVAVVDAFATTDFSPGDRITFSVARAATPNAKELSFRLFRFPTGPCATASTDDSNPVAAAKAPTGSCHS